MTPRTIRNTITNLTQHLALSGTDLLLSTPTKPTTRQHLYIQRQSFLTRLLLALSASFAPSSGTLSRGLDPPAVSSRCPGNFVALRCCKNAGSLPFPARTRLSWLCLQQSASVGSTRCELVCLQAASIHLVSSFCLPLWCALPPSALGTTSVHHRLGPILAHPSVCSVSVHLKQILSLMTDGTIY